MKTRIHARASRHISIAIFGVAVLAAAPAGAQVNKCVDRAGKVVGYASECPAGTKSEATNIRNTPSASAAGTASSASASTGNSIAEQEAGFRKRQMEKQESQAKAGKLAADQQARTQACDSARSYLKSLQSGVRIVRTDPNTGERIVLDDASHAKETDAAQRAVSANCK
jgi:hypothetical protein